VRIPLSGGDYNGAHLDTGPVNIYTGEYLRIERLPNDRTADQFYLMHSNGVARHDPHFTGSPSFMFTHGEVDYRG
jgi:hypothetical protein